MISEIIAVSQSVKALEDLLKAATELKNFDDFVTAIFEINAKLMDAQVAALKSQEKQSALTIRIGELEQKIMELDNWKQESERYELTELCPGVVNFTLKPGKENGETPHRLCAHCFSKRQKGYLQQSEIGYTGTFYKCSSCDKEINDYSHKKPTPSNRSNFGEW